MGKTGTVQWVQVKGVKGQIRLVPKAEGELKRAGPNQRFKAGASLKKLEAATEAPGGAVDVGDEEDGEAVAAVAASRVPLQIP
jgi:hypothetical protein